MNSGENLWSVKRVWLKFFLILIVGSLVFFTEANNAPGQNNDFLETQSSIPESSKIEIGVVPHGNNQSISLPGGPLYALVVSAVQNDAPASYEVIQVDKGFSYIAFNSANDYSLGFTSSGIEISPQSGNTWRLGMRLKGYGYGDNIQPVSNPGLAIDGNRVEYHYNEPTGDLTEWYLNGPLGLEQGLTLETPPPGEADNGLVFEFKLKGGFTPILSNDKKNVRFQKVDSPTLTYGGLYVYDSTGRQLPAEIILTDAQSLSIHIDDKKAIYPLTIDPFFTNETKLTANNPGAGDSFGVSVDINGDIAVVGAYLKEESSLNNAGAAYVFNRTGTTWTQTQKLTPSDPKIWNKFGLSVAISGDTIVIGASDGIFGGTSPGAAYIFKHSGTAWTQVQKLTASDGAPEDLFGTAVDISGNTVVVGAYFDDDASFSSGSAYVFEYTGTTWSQIQKLTASDAASSDVFGYSVAIDADRIVVGAYGDADVGQKTGSAYIFERFLTGSWPANETKKVTASDAAGFVQFGWSVDINGDTVVVGANWDDGGGFFRSGSAYVFERSGGAWPGVETQKLTASDAGDTDLFGYSVAVNGKCLVVGAMFDDNPNSNSGSVYVYKRSGLNWTFTQKLSPGTEVINSSFGGSVSLDGADLIVGAPSGGAGAAYVFDSLANPDCTEQDPKPEIELSITKTPILDCYSDGVCAFEVIITNNGTDPFNGPIQVFDDWGPGGIAFQAASGDWVCDYTPLDANMTCDNPSVTLAAGGGTTSFIIMLEVPENLEGQVLTNCVQIQWPQTGGMNGDSIPENDFFCTEVGIKDCRSKEN